MKSNLVYNPYRREYTLKVTWLESDLEEVKSESLREALSGPVEDIDGALHKVWLLSIALNQKAVVENGFSEYGHYGENNPPLEPMSPVGDKEYDV